MAAPDVLANIKDDLGIAADDTSQDAWLQRRLDGLWTRIEAYTVRTLPSPAREFIDDWGQLVQTFAHRNRPPAIAYRPRGTVYLRVFPVVSITECVLNDQTQDPLAVMFDAASGKLLATADQQLATDLGSVLTEGRARVTYMAGWNALPADLYEVLQGAMIQAWAARQAQQSGMGGAGITGVNAVDVGSVEFGKPNAFLDAATKPGSGVDPLLGPYTELLAPYVDWRSTTGAATIPATEGV